MEKLVGARVQGYTVKRGVARYNIYVTLRQGGGGDDGSTTMLELEAARQRWSVCVALDQMLKKRFSKSAHRMPVLASPNRYLRGASKLDVAFLESRAHALNDYLSDMMKLREVRESEALLEFLSNDIADAAELEKQATARTATGGGGNEDGNGNGNGSSFDKYKIEESIRSQLRTVPFTDVRVGAKEVHEKEVHVSTAEVTVVYEFKTEAKDIGLSVGFRPDAGNATTRNVAGFSRWPSHLRSQLKHFSCPCPGTLILTWDNSYSKFRHKALSYRFALTSTEALEWLVSQDGGRDSGGGSGSSGSKSGRESGRRLMGKSYEEEEEEKQDRRAGGDSKRANGWVDAPTADRVRRGSATDAAAESSAKRKQRQTDSRRRMGGITTSPPLRTRFPGRMPTESFEVSAKFGRKFNPSGFVRAVPAPKMASSGADRDTSNTPGGANYSDSAVERPIDVVSELESLRVEVLQNEQEMNSMQAQLDDQNERSQHLEDDLMKAFAAKTESDEQCRNQSAARAVLEREKAELEIRIAELEAARISADDAATSMRARLESSSRSSSAEVDALMAQNRELERRLAETIAPLEVTAKEAKQLQQQAEAELMASRNMMRRHAADLKSLKPKYASLQSKVDRFKTEKRILVKAVEELRTAKAVFEAQLEESRKFQEHQRQQYTQTQLQYAESHRELKEKSRMVQEMQAMVSGLSPFPAILCLLCDLCLTRVILLLLPISPPPPSPPLKLFSSNKLMMSARAC
jgi:hypothetical protein